MSFKRTLRFSPFINEEYFLPDLVFTLKLYDTREQMHRAIKRQDKREQTKDWDMHGTAGLFRGYERITYCDGKEIILDTLGEMFLNIEDLFPDADDFTKAIEIVSHESLHAVIAYVRRVHNEIPKFNPVFPESDDSMEDCANEITCDFLGRLTACVCAWVNYYKNNHDTL